MADRLTLDVAPRETLRKGNKALRREGTVPVHVYGHGVDSQSLQAPERELRHVLRQAGSTGLIELTVGGKTDNVMVRHVQRHPVNGRLIHVDLLHVRMDQPIKARIPLVFVGDAAGVTVHDGVLQHLVEAVNVEGLPADLPHNIEVDISGLADIDAALHVRDLVAPGRITIIDDPEELVVKIQPPRRAEEEAPAEEAGAEAAAEGAPAAEAEAPAAASEEAAAESA
ncbi:MAG: 50S ribosomal protein L25 [Chloroflexi bacterium]|nr:50S ribosomal protein L25 [Chloroflexota bacterium]